jgi:hypothetical protein
MSGLAWFCWLYLATGAWTFVFIVLMVKSVLRTGPDPELERLVREATWARILVGSIVFWPRIWIAAMRDRK